MASVGRIASRATAVLAGTVTLGAGFAGSALAAPAPAAPVGLFPAGGLGALSTVFQPTDVTMPAAEPAAEPAAQPAELPVLDLASVLSELPSR